MEKHYEGMYVLADGRKSLCHCASVKLELKNWLKGQAVTAMRISGSPWCEILIWNQFGYVQEHYVIMPDGKRAERLGGFLPRIS